MQKSIETYGLPLGLILLGYGPLAIAGADAPWLAAMRLLLHFLAALLVARLGLRMGLNRTAALLACLFFAASPLAAYSLLPGAFLVVQVWVCLVLGFLVWRLKARRPGRLGWAALAGAVMTGTVGTMALTGVLAVGGNSLTAIPRNLLTYAAWLILPVSRSGNIFDVSWGLLVLGGGVWAFWIMMSVHRYLLDNPWPRNLLILTCGSLLPLLGRSAGPGLMLLPVALFSLFLMTFLRPSKLVDSPRVLLMGAFFLTLLASETSALIIG